MLCSHFHSTIQHHHLPAISFALHLASIVLAKRSSLVPLILRPALQIESMLYYRALNIRFDTAFWPEHTGVAIAEDVGMKGKNFVH